MKTLIWMTATVGFAMTAPVQAQAPRDGERLFAMIDVNGDGKLDKIEIAKMMAMRAERRGDPSLNPPEKIDAFLKRADTNGDGAVDKAELGAMRGAMREGRPDAKN
ncbi:EF-hand domain-containing protein [Sphingopyxis sp. P8]|uniref:EF-hand domain-containing protein n=1 Tax=Sphingopyxis sp. P8 TaxID=2763256 RepID=UPI001D0B60E4|nr:EF-hand domain-containing protein [Sphingopyxis sp. P8]